MKFYELNGFYGCGKTPTATTIFVGEKYNGAKWYCSMGSENVNLTYDDMQDGVNIEHLNDSSYFHWEQPINDLEELEKAIDA